MIWTAFSAVIGIALALVAIAHWRITIALVIIAWGIVHIAWMVEYEKWIFAPEPVSVKHSELTPEEQARYRKYKATKEAVTGLESEGFDDEPIDCILEERGLTQLEYMLKDNCYGLKAEQIEQEQKRLKKLKEQRELDIRILSSRLSRIESENIKQKREH